MNDEIIKKSIIKLALDDSSKILLFDVFNDEITDFSWENGKFDVRGKKNLKPYFESHPEDWKKLYDKVYEKISIKDDSTIKSFEELLGINNLDEYLGITEEDKD